MGPCSGDPTHFFGRHLTKLTTTTHRAGSGLLRETARRDPHASSLLAGEGWAEADCRAHRRPRMRERPMLTTRPPEPGDESWTATLVQPLEGDAGSLRPSSEPTPFNRCDRDRAHNTELSGEGPRPSARTSSAPILCSATRGLGLSSARLSLVNPPKRPPASYGLAAACPIPVRSRLWFFSRRNDSSEVSSGTRKTKAAHQVPLTGTHTTVSTHLMT